MVLFTHEDYKLSYAEHVADFGFYGVQCFVDFEVEVIVMLRRVWRISCDPLHNWAAGWRIASAMVE